MLRRQQEFLPNLDGTIIFHQWGYTHNPSKSGIIIEDSVDTLITPKGNVFPCDGRFELLSLPKIFGTIFGGVVFLSNPDRFRNTQKIRKDRKLLKWKHIFDKLRAKSSETCSLRWNSCEPMNGFLPSIICQNIVEQVSNIDKLIEDRLEKLNLFESSKIKLMKKWDNTRLPTCVPISLKDSKSYNEEYIDFLLHISPSNDFQELEKVLPLGTHKSIRKNDLENFC